MLMGRQQGGRVLKLIQAFKMERGRKGGFLEEC